MANNFNPLQAQGFSLAGSGCVIGDTTLVLKSMTTIDGALVTMAMLGSYAFMTLEPGNGINEEQIKFTGITQNANGTATLTGVSNVSFGTPYTVTSGVLKTHAGSVTAILSNTSGFYESYVAKDDDGTISEVLTFTQPNFPQMDGVTTPPTLPAQLVTKSYADSLSYAGTANASTSAKGIVQIATQAQVDAKTLIGSTSAVLVQPLNTQRSTLLSDYVIDTSTSPNIITIAPSPAITSYITGQTFSFKLANTNTSPTVSLNVNGLGAKNMIVSGLGSPVAGALTAGQMIVVEYDGTNVQVISPEATTISPSGSPTQGDIVYYNGSAWVRLGVGTSGQILETLGASANPQWQTKLVPTSTFMIGSGGGNYTTTSTSFTDVDAVNLKTTVSGLSVGTKLLIRMSLIYANASSTGTAGLKLLDVTNGADVYVPISTNGPAGGGEQIYGEVIYVAPSTSIQFSLQWKCGTNGSSTINNTSNSFNMNTFTTFGSAVGGQNTTTCMIWIQTIT